MKPERSDIECPNCKRQVKPNDPDHEVEFVNNIQGDGYWVVTVCSVKPDYKVSQKAAEELERWFSK